MTRVLICSPYPVVRLGLATLIGRQFGMAVAGEADTPKAAAGMLAAVFPDVVLVCEPPPAGILSTVRVAVADLDAALSEVVRAVRTVAALPAPKPLTRREAEVLRLAAQGYGHKEIAAGLKLSVKTVEVYKTRGWATLGLGSRVELVQYALARGWLADDAYPLPPPSPHPSEVAGGGGFAGGLGGV